MRRTDVAIVGGGLAGSTAAAMLGRANIQTVLIDPHDMYPADFRCEKLGGTQLPILQRTGLAEPVFRAATSDRAVWIARFGRLIDKKASDQHGILYQDLVNTIRAEIPPAVTFINAKVATVSTGAEQQIVTLANGEQISARLVVLANGLNVGLRQALGITRTIISTCHSITIGCDFIPVGRPAFDFPALTYYPERTVDRMAYLTLFPVGQAMRANLMVYRDIDDPWLRQLRNAPVETMHALMPSLRRLTGNFEVSLPLKIRPADLYLTEGHRQPGVVLVGDAFATSCPAAGTGCDKVFTDVERLCNIHIPQWLANSGMGIDKINAFYDDPVKLACDSYSHDKAYTLRSISIDGSPLWMLQRWARFLVRFGIGTLHQARQHVATRSWHRRPPTVETSR
jgi:2-polyprenyl-6-methoxyphenol hydroxylase-like FAD-dependent oxidoreductase